MINILRTILMLGLLTCAFFTGSSVYYLLVGETSGIFVMFTVAFPCVFVFILKTLLRVSGEDE